MNARSDTRASGKGASGAIREQPEREDRILFNIVVDAYNEEERAMGWHYYLQDTIQFPFAATCIERASTSPLREGQVLQIVSMADEDDCCTEMRVNIEYDHALLGGAAGAVAMRACKR